jgi:hypothetical protein
MRTCSARIHLGPSMSLTPPQGGVSQASAWLLLGCSWGLGGAAAVAAGGAGTAYLIRGEVPVRRVAAGELVIMTAAIFVVYRAEN